MTTEERDKRNAIRRNRSNGQQRRLDREFAEGYYAYLRGRQSGTDRPPVSGGAPLDTGQYITVPDAARRLGLSRQRVYLLVKQGRIEAVRVGEGPKKVWLVNGDALHQREVGFTRKEKEPP
jgi:excisionase family DNA binding protein